MTNDSIAKIKKILENAQGNALDICSTLYREYLLTSETPSAVLQEILQFSAYPIGNEDDKVSNLMSAEDERTIRLKYYRLAKEIVRVLAKENLPVEQFYTKVYDQIFASKLFPDDEKVKIVILKSLAEYAPEVPYFQAKDLLSMTDEAYQSATERVDGQIIKAIHMLNRHFDSRTEEASQLCRLADEISDEQDRVVYWAVIVSTLKEGMRKREGID